MLSGRNCPQIRYGMENFRQKERWAASSGDVPDEAARCCMILYS